MLSRPSRDQVQLLGNAGRESMLPGSDSILLRRGTHAFAAGRARAIYLFSEGRESMAPTWHSQSCTTGNATPTSFS
jgi:hypothetical protein